MLKSVEFPSVLVETAFINNPIEARLLAQPRVPEARSAQQLATGVQSYFERAGVGLSTPGAADVGGRGAAEAR